MFKWFPWFDFHRDCRSPADKGRKIDEVDKNQGAFLWLGQDQGHVGEDVWADLEQEKRANQMNGKGKIREKIFSAKLANQIFSLEWKNRKRQGVQWCFTFRNPNLSEQTICCSSS